MFTSHRKPGIGGVAASGLLFDSDIRSAAAQAAPPLMRLGFSIGKRAARRKARYRFDEASQTIATIASVLSTLLPQLAEQLGLIEPPKKQRRIGPALAGAAIVTVGAVYLSDPDHRQKVQQLIVH